MTAYLDRVFTVSTSFSPTYRFPGMGTAEKIVATKFTKLKSGSIEDFIKDSGAKPSSAEQVEISFVSIS